MEIKIIGLIGYGIIGLIGYGIIAIAFIIFLFILFGGESSKEKQKKYNPKYAERMERLDGITPNRGTMACVVSPQKWVIIKWNKEKNFLDIVTAPQGWLKQEDKVFQASLNWKIVKEKVPEKVTVEKYFGNRRVM